MPTDILQIDPFALIVLFAAGGGVIYVVRLFTAAQTVREREMWTAINSIMTRTEKMSELWLTAIQAQGDKSSEATKALAGETASLKAHIAELTAKIDRSMLEILRDGAKRRILDEKEQ